MTVQLDHLVYAVHDLHAAIDEFEQRSGVRPAFGGQHVGHGTHNALASLDDGSYLELIAPDPRQDEPPLPRAFGVDRLVDPKLAGWAVRCDDIAATVARARSHGYDPGDPVPMERATPDGNVLRWQLTMASAGGGVIPFLIDWGATPHPSQSTPAGLRVVELTIEHPHPDEIRATLDAIGITFAIERAPAPALVALLDGPAGRFELR